MVDTQEIRKIVAQLRQADDTYPGLQYSKTHVDGVERKHCLGCDFCPSKLADRLEAALEGSNEPEETPFHIKVLHRVVR